MVDPPATFFLAGGVTPDRPQVQYPIVRSSAPFDRVIISPNGTISETGSIEFCVGETMADFVPLVEWAGTQAAVAEGHKFPAPVNVDVLQLDTATRELTIISRRFAGDATTTVTRLGITLYDSQIELPFGTGYSSVVPPDFSPLALPVEFLSQFAAGMADDDSKCCPTSAVMLLRFWGIDIEVRQFARLSYDRRHRVYGNWSLTVAAMSSFGIFSWVQRHRSLRELYSIVQAGRPVIVSISFGPGALPGAPIEKSAGHLLVVRGFTDSGDVLVNDPAGRTVDTGRVIYDQSAFVRAWLGHGGIALHAVPEESV